MEEIVVAGCRPIVKGYAEGVALVTSEPINFLSMVSVSSGAITDPKHELYGKSLKNNILVFPHAIGSSVGAYALHSLSKWGTAPAAILCSRADITTSSGCAIANIPLLLMPKGHLSNRIPSGSLVKVDAIKGKITAKV